MRIFYNFENQNLNKTVITSKVLVFLGILFIKGISGYILLLIGLILWLIHLFTLAYKEITEKKLFSIFYGIVILFILYIIQDIIKVIILS